MSLANAARTAMSRTDVSRPVQLALADGVMRQGRTFFDYGCGRGGDVNRLAEAGFEASGWDPAHSPESAVAPADVVNLGYVVNVIEDRTERADTLRRAWALARDVLVVAARPDWESAQVRGHPRGDGIVTSKGTFQKFSDKTSCGHGSRWPLALSLSLLAQESSTSFETRPKPRGSAFGASGQEHQASLGLVERTPCGRHIGSS